MAFESDTWTSPALQPRTRDHTIPRKDRRPSRYNAFISLDELDAPPRHRQSFAERRSRYDLASPGRVLADVPLHSPRTLPPEITLTSPQQSTARPGHTATNSVSYDDTEPFLGPAPRIRSPEPKSQDNSEEPPHRSHLPRFHFGP